MRFMDDRNAAPRVCVLEMVVMVNPYELFTAPWKRIPSKSCPQKP
jgi:hypothetical protein